MRPVPTRLSTGGPAQSSRPPFVLFPRSRRGLRVKGCRSPNSLESVFRRERRGRRSSFRMISPRTHTRKRGILSLT